MKHAFQKRAVFAGCARDCAAALPRVLANVARMAGLFAEAAFVFIENDSRDATKSLLGAWCGERPNARLISLDGFAASCPIRTIRLATARNRYLSAVRSEFSDYNLLIALDCDEVNAMEIDLAAVGRAMEFLEQDASHAAVFANSEGVYYDMWTLRHPDRCPGDVWEEVCDYALTRRAPDQEAFAETFAKRIFALPRNAPPLEVASAFGGLGIYKLPDVLRNNRNFIGHKSKPMPGPDRSMRQVGWQVCEHVFFHAGFREAGRRLFIFPGLVNFSAVGLTFPPGAWRSMLFDIALAASPPFDPQDPATWGKIARNEACPCGSGRRYKHCHGALT
jgi:SEC-C motif